MLQIRLLGQFDVRLDGKRILIPSRAGQSLLAYLALTAGTPHRREKLAGIFWPETSDENARRNLRQELWRIRKAISTQKSSGGDYLLAEELTITFNRETEYWLDARQMDKSELDLQSLTANLSLYQGELLPGFYEEWVVLERERIQSVFDTKMEQIVEQLVAAERWMAVQEQAERWLSLGNTLEPAYRALMLAYGARGDIAKVSSVYQRCMDELDEQFGLEPSAETRALYEGLLKGAQVPGRPIAIQFSGTVTFLFTDIEESTNLLETLGSQYAMVLAEHHKVLRAAIQKWNGTEVATQGDSFFITFPRALDAVQCATEAQRALASHTWSHGQLLQVRMGLHTGEPLIGSTGYVGMDVHRAARIGDAAHGGQVLLSQTTRDLILHDLPQGVTVRGLGEHRFKDLKFPTPIYQLVIEGLPHDFPPLRTKFTGTEAPTPGEPPFKGLQYFEEADSNLFFGRELLTAKLVDRLRETQFLFVIIGASGSGKSSLVRAGLIPAIKIGEVLLDGTHPSKGSAEWRIHVVTPTTHPLQALATELTRGSESVTAAATLMDDLMQDPRSLALFLARQNPNQHILLVVDQFEELFTLCHDEFEREAFIDNLLATLNQSDSNITLILTLRADFYAHLAQYPELRDAVAKQQEYIGPMTTDELRRAIEEPAKQGHWAFEPGLVDLILRDVGDEPGALPLLSHALLETWKRRAGYTLTLKGYADAGGVRGAIAHTAESVYQYLSFEEQTIARNIFLRLTELGEGTEDTRRRASFDELMSDEDNVGEVRRVLNLLAEARLITLGEDTAEVAHEALIREWPTLREWLNQDRAGLQLHRRLTESAHEWELLERDAGALYRGANLAQVREWSVLHPNALNAGEKTFLEASNALEQSEVAEREAQQKRELEAAQKLAETERQRAEEQAHAATQLRKRAVFLGVSFLLAIALAGVALFFSSQARQNAAEADRQRDAAQKSEANALAQKRIATSRELAATALTNLGVDAQRSALLALQAVKTTQEQDKIVLPEAEDALHRAVLAARAQLTLGSGKKPIYRAIYSPDGSQVATRLDGSIHLWDAKTGKEVLHILSTAGYDNVVFSTDGTQLAILDYDSDNRSHLWAKIFDAHSGKLMRQTNISMTVDDWSLSDFSSDLTKVVVGSHQNTAKVWDTHTGQLLQTLSGHQAPVLEVRFSPDAKKIVTTSADGSAKIWDATTGKELLNLCCHTQPVYGTAFSPDGSKVATSSDDRTVKIWDASAGNELLTLVGHTDQVLNVAFSADGKQVVGPSTDRTTLVWDSETGNQLYKLAGHTNEVQDASFSPDGKHIVTASDDGSSIVWDATPSHEVAAISTFPIWRSAINQDRTRLATRQDDSRFMVWDLTLREPITTIIDQDAHQADIQADIAISPDGKRVAYATNNSVKVWNVESDKQMFRLAPNNQNIQPSYVGIPIFSADGQRILDYFDYPREGQVLRRVLIWDATSGAQVAELSLPKIEGSFGAIAESPDGTRLVVGDSSGAVRLFDAQTGKMLREEHNPSFVVNVLFSPDGKQYIAASVDGTALVRDTTTGSVLFPTLTNSATIYDMSYSSDGKYIATAGLDGVAKVWDASSGKELHVLQANSAQVRGAHFNANGTHLFTTGMDGVIREYTLNIEELVELAKARLTRSLTTEECQQYLHVEACPAEQ